MEVLNKEQMEKIQEVITNSYIDNDKPLSLQDVIKLLPDRMLNEFGKVFYLHIDRRSVSYVAYENNPLMKHELKIFVDTNILNGAYNMLLWVVEKGMGYC